MAAALEALKDYALHLLDEVLGFLLINEAARDYFGAGHKRTVLSREGQNDDYHTVLRKMLPVAEHHAAHVSHTAAVHEHASRGDDVHRLDALAAELYYAAVFCDDDVVRRDAHHAAQLRVLAEHAILTVDRDEKLRLRQGQHHLLVLL